MSDAPATIRGSSAGLDEPVLRETSVSEGEFLTFFDPAYSAQVAAWIRTELELNWLAPGTPWPLTAAKVAAWGEERRERFLLWNGRDDAPIGYAELNEMPKTRDQMWIGHFVLDPACRGRSWGVRFAQALIARAFVERHATDVLLVVIPENLRAIRCYQRAGMINLGQERKHFKSTGREYLFNRMGISRGRFRMLSGQGRMPVGPLSIREIPACAAR